MKRVLYMDFHITSEDGTQINFSEKMARFLQGANTEYGESGIMSAAALLGHEFGHACFSSWFSITKYKDLKKLTNPYNQNPTISQKSMDG